MKRIIQHEEGSIIASVVLLITLSSVLLLGMTYIIKNQVIQYHNIKNAYEAKSILAMSEFIVSERIENDALKTGGMIRFSNGQVEVEILPEEQINLDATLTNGFTSSKRLPLILSTSEKDSVDEQEEKIEGNKSNSNQPTEETPNKALLKEDNTTRKNALERQSGER